MIPIVTIDDHMGVSFNNRRQSRDSVLCDYLIEFTKDKTLWMEEYSSNLFSQFDATNIKIDCNFLVKADADDYCFIEKKALNSKIKKLIVCRWNRVYPADTYLSLDYKKYKVRIIDEIKGKSHDKITIEEWIL